MDIQHILRNAAAVEKDRNSYYTDRVAKDAVPQYKALEGYPGICVWHRGNKPHLYGFRIRISREKKVTRYGFASKEAAQTARTSMLCELNIDPSTRNNPNEEKQRQYIAALKEQIKAAKPGDVITVEIHQRNGIISQQNYIRNVATAYGRRVSMKTLETTFRIVVKKQ